MNRDWLRCFINDAACVVALVVVGTRNHDTDTGLGGVFTVAAPFLIALFVVQALTVVPGFKVSSLLGGLLIASFTVAIGMGLRAQSFGRGTALPFVIVASAFLMTTMVGWRAFTMWREKRIAAAGL